MKRCSTSRTYKNRSSWRWPSSKSSKTPKPQNPKAPNPIQQMDVELAVNEQAPSSTEYHVVLKVCTEENSHWSQKRFSGAGHAWSRSKTESAQVVSTADWLMEESSVHSWLFAPSRLCSRIAFTQNTWKLKKINQIILLIFLKKVINYIKMGILVSTKTSLRSSSWSSWF